MESPYTISHHGYMAKLATKLTRAAELRVARGYTQAEASRLMGVGQPTLGKIEDETNDISKNMRPKMAKAYAVDERELFAKVGDPIPEPLWPLAPSPPPSDRTRKKRDDIIPAQPPFDSQGGEQPKSLQLLRVWEEIPLKRQDLALRVLRALIDPKIG